MVMLCRNRQSVAALWSKGGMEFVDGCNWSGSMEPEMFEEVKVRNQRLVKYIVK